ncbi:baseplate J/gp47 family protein [Accumulibacter sp.]|uniref:baseplate J/gp47 family protein n=1 Tax=Accumulibacter sp. TaxID=2053492 RepID=UPI002637CB16|nr:baseplate J/gp47 family protein [Accumulibacter sp.]
MIDPGHPFSKSFQRLVDGLVGSLQLGVEQAAALELIYRSGTTSYSLHGVGPLSGLAEQITGFVAGRPAVFKLGQHYTYAVGQLVWQPLPAAADPEIAASWFPDDNSRLNVGYYFRDLPSGITDFNAGSVAGTLVRSLAREFKLLYEQMDQAYRRAFIDFAEGAALDNVVALLGVARNQALPAQGKVTFWLRKAPRNDLAIAVGTRVADARGRLFKVTAPGVIRATLVEEVAAAGKVAHTSVAIANLLHVRVKGGTSNLATIPSKAGKPFGDDETTITLAAVPSSSMLVVTFQARRPQVEVPVIALDNGPEGNLGSGSLTVMPTPPRGVDGGVVNEQPLSGGVAAEGDEQLRERAKHALERAGNATLNAIRYAVMTIDGVDSVEVRDCSLDAAIPLGEVWVRFSTGKPDLVGPLVSDIVERTRAAGIKAVVSQVRTVTLSGSFLVIGDASGNLADARQRYRLAVIAALKALAIGEAVSPRKLAALAFRIAGLADTGEVQLDYVRGSAAPAAVDRDPFVIDTGEQARPDEGALSVRSLHALHVSTASLAVDGRLTLSLRVTDDDGLALRFRNFQLALLATVRAKLASTPNQPLQQVAQVAGTVTLAAAEQATPVFATVLIANRASLDAASAEIVVQAAAYPGIVPASAHLAL